MAVRTGKAKVIGAEEAHARNVEAIARRIAKRETRIRQIMRELKTLRLQNRQDRRELRAVLQRKPIDIENEIQARVHDVAGMPDAIDISEHHRER
jgi:hypothetical protein